MVVETNLLGSARAEDVVYASYGMRSSNSLGPWLSIANGYD